MDWSESTGSCPSRNISRPCVRMSAAALRSFCRRSAGSTRATLSCIFFVARERLFCFASWLPAPPSSRSPPLQPDADVRNGEADQRRRFLGLGRPFLSLERVDGARLSPLVATAADDLCLVGGQASGMVQTFLGGVLPLCRNHCPVFHLGAAAVAASRVRFADFSPTVDRAHRQLLLLQFAHHRALPAAHR